MKKQFARNVQKFLDNKNQWVKQNNEIYSGEC